MTNSDQLSLFADSGFVEQAKKLAGVRAGRSGTFGDNLRLPIHRWFRYSAGFSAEWAEDLIRSYSSSRPVVFDPFAGSGTTLVAAEKANAVAVGFESHPFVYRIAEAKLLWHLDERRLLELGAGLIERARKAETSAPGTVPALLAKCYTRAALEQLYALRSAFEHISARLDGTPEQAFAKLLWLALTAILRSCSHVGTAQWQYVLPNKRKASTLDPFEAFRAKMHEMASDMAFAKLSGFASSAKVYLRDSRSIQTLDDVVMADLVITSPPYPNNYDYADATRLEMTFWGEISSWGDLQESVRQFIVRSCSQHAAAERLQLDDLLFDPVVASIQSELSAVCKKLAEVRLMKGGRKTYHTMIAAYFVDLARVFVSLRKVCRRGSTVCFVIGDSAPYGVYVPADQWLGRLAVSAGFESFSFEKLRDRNIKWKNRKHRVPLHEGRLWIKG